MNKQVQVDDLWFPYRYGLKCRKKLLRFCSSYGGKFFKIRRPLVVFLSAILDENHQETMKGTLEYNLSRNE